jgi:hypothetical protein
MWIWRDMLGQPIVDQRGVTGRDGRVGRGVPAECITFVTRAAEQAGCMQMTEPESFARHLKRLRDNELPEVSLLRQPTDGSNSEP